VSDHDRKEDRKYIRWWPGTLSKEVGGKTKVVASED
jgi:hypothetical protein